MVNQSDYVRVWDDNSDGERREAARGNAKSVSRGADGGWMVTGVSERLLDRERKSKSRAAFKLEQ
jgi:hypothetical protein